MVSRPLRIDGVAAAGLQERPADGVDQSLSVTRRSCETAAHTAFLAVVRDAPDRRLALALQCACCRVRASPYPFHIAPRWCPVRRGFAWVSAAVGRLDHAGSLCPRNPARGAGKPELHCRETMMVPVHIPRPQLRPGKLALQPTESEEGARALARRLHNWLLFLFCTSSAFQGSLCCLSRARRPKQVFDICREGACKFFKHRHGRILQPAFEAADISPIDARINGKHLLREPPCDPQPPYVSCNQRAGSFALLNKKAAQHVMPGRIEYASHPWVLDGLFEYRKIGNTGFEKQGKDGAG
ncbi:MAG: hypothetical protein QOJ86_2151 [Bradyrhizobium sp.]|nr:hypothetical protein [Bradyrhizobium sp.]